MADGTLGILITKHANAAHIAGLVAAAHRVGHAVRVFMTDEGVRFTRDQEFLSGLQDANVQVAVCEYNCEQAGYPDRAEGIRYGSQYDNAGMLHECERVLVF